MLAETVLFLFVVFDDLVSSAFSRWNNIRLHAWFCTLQLQSLERSLNQPLKIFLSPLVKCKNLLNVFFLVFTVDHNPHEELYDINELIEIIVLYHVFIVVV